MATGSGIFRKDSTVVTVRKKNISSKSGNLCGTLDIRSVDMIEFRCYIGEVVDWLTHNRAELMLLYIILVVRKSLKMSPDI